ncbi:MAG: hypothetical protein JRN59_06040 [Nitrososphaerota archaeon]|jgi:hypothetical protein|nr:hypothetical protein [Nitrososphaerota archaeon]
MRRMSSWLIERSGVLRTELGFDGYMPEVLGYLFEKRVYKRVSACSAHEVYRGIRSFQRNHQPTLKHKNATEKSVRQALEDLCNLGITQMVGPEEVPDNGGEGRRPKVMFRLKPASEIMTALRARLDARVRKLVEFFQELEDVEEARTEGREPHGKTNEK